MIRLRPTLPFVALCFLSSAVLRAQTAAVPDAPAPQKPGLTLSVPLPLPGPNDAAADERAKATEVCGGPAEGIFALGKNGVPEGQLGPANAYMKNAFGIVQNNWTEKERPKHDLSNHVSHPHVVRLRFVIRPDGTYSFPEVTGKSGDPRDDERAMAAVREVGVFPRLPFGFEKPIVACMRFGYNTDSNGMHTTADEPWLNKAVDGKKP